MRSRTVTFRPEYFPCSQSTAATRSTDADLSCALDSSLVVKPTSPVLLGPTLDADRGHASSMPMTLRAIIMTTISPMAPRLAYAV